MRIVILIKVMLLAMLSLNVHAKQAEMDTIAPKIIGGTNVDESNSPYGFFAQISVGCGGAHIGNGIVLTAAHCVEHLHDSGIKVNFPHDPNLNNVDFDALYVKSHPAYTSVVAGYDVAIIKIEDKDGRYPESVSLLTNNQYSSFSSAQALTVIGYGVTETGNVSAQLKEVVVNQVSDSQCRTAYEFLDGSSTDSIFIEDLMMCASAPGKDSCQGDSGGPLLYKDYQGNYYHAGIVSFGYGCAEPEYPGVYTRTDTFNTWITDFINKTIYVDFNSTNSYLHTQSIADNKVEVEFTNLGLKTVSMKGFEVESDASVYGLSSCLDVAGESIAQYDSLTCELILNNVDSGDDLSIEYSYLVSGAFNDVDETVEAPLYVLDSINFTNKNGLGDFEYFSWAQSATNPWSYDAYNGNFTSTAKTNYGTSVLSLNGYFSGGIKFDFSMESELGYDLFYVTVDGKMQKESVASGVCKDQSFTLALPAGKHRVAFVYAKDDSYAEGIDEVKISNFESLSDTVNTSDEPNCYAWYDDEPTLRTGSINLLFLFLMGAFGLVMRRKVA